MTESFEYYYRIGLNRFKSEEWNLAVADFKKAMKADADAASTQNVYLYLGVALKKMGPDHFSEAVKYLNKSVKVWPDEAEHYFHLGHIYWQQFVDEQYRYEYNGEVHRSIDQGKHQEYSNQHIYHPDAAKIFDRSFLKQTGLLKKSITSYQKSIKRDKANPLYWHNLTIASHYQDSKDLEKRTELFFQTRLYSIGEITINNPILLTTTRELAIHIVYSFPKDESRARLLRNLFGFIFDTDKENSESWLNMCLALEEAGEFQEAADLLQKAINQFVNTNEFHYCLARVLAKDGRLEEAIRGFKKFLTFNDEIGEHNKQSTYGWLIDILIDKGDFKQAISYLVERGPLWDDDTEQYKIDPEDYHQFLVKLKNIFDKTDSKSLKKPIPDLELFLGCLEVEKKIRKFIHCVIPDENEWWGKITNKEFKQRVEDQINTYKAQQFLKIRPEEISILDWFSFADYPKIFNRNWPRFSIFITGKKFPCNMQIFRDTLQQEIIEISRFRNNFAHLRPISDIGRLKATAAILALDGFLSEMVGE